MGYLNLVDSFLYGEPVFRAKLDALAENDSYLKDNGWQTSSKTLFFQAAAPTNWTKDTTNNDKYLRVVDSAGLGTGGTKAPSASITLAHSAHSLTTAPAHTHDLGSHTHYLSNASSNGSSPGGTSQYLTDNGGYLYKLNASGTGSTFAALRNFLSATGFLTSGSDGSHNHGGNSTGSALSDITFAYCDVIVCGKNSSSGYVDLTSEFQSGDKIDFDPFVDLAGNDEYLRLRLMPSGSILILGQATAPEGWTKITSLDDKALRVVSGSGGGNGGSQSPSAQITMTHTHSTSSDSGHSHTIANHTHSMNVSVAGFNYSPVGTGDDKYVQADGSNLLRNSGVSGPTASRTAYQTQTASDGSGSTATNAAHTHSLASGGTNFTLAYLDIIQCSKNAAGEPYAYEDVTSGVFGWKKLVSKQKLNKLAKNDEYNLYHTTPSGSKAFFYMSSAPLMWTKLTTQNDKILRVVSGSSGGTAGGSQATGTALPLAHTHVIQTVAHTHGMGTHTHSLASGSQTANAIGTNGFGGTLVSNGIPTLQSNAGGSNTLLKTSVAGVGNSDSVSHDHGGTSGSTLTDVTLAYVDVIYCTKD